MTLIRFTLFNKVIQSYYFFVKIYFTLDSMESVKGLKWAIAKVVKELRTSKGWTQEQLAGFSGLSAAYITKLERGACGDSINALLLHTQAIGKRPSEVMLAIEKELTAGHEILVWKKRRPQKDYN